MLIYVGFQQIYQTFIPQINYYLNY